jgi:serine/threonine protein kinase/Tol biopolymer transport system component
MNPDENIGVLEAARAIAAGRRVDWAAIESSADLSESLAGLLRELKIVEDIAELHRSLPDPISSLSDPAGSSLSPQTVETAAPAATWGSLRLLERVGEGAFGDVFRAWDPRLDREVALKLLRRPDSQHDSVGSSVIDEGRLLARVRHPNVVTVYGADRIDGRVGLWMEFVRGRTLEVVLKDHGPFGAQEAALIGLDVCRALSAVHRAGLIHRDIKAHNVMRESGGRIVLMDFGTGREDLADSDAELAGTPLYLAPEVFAGKPATTRSDIYSVGVLLYHLATGSYPVKGRTVADLREGHAKRRRAWLRDERPDLPDRFVQAVERSLAEDPAERYESAGAMEAALARVMSTSDSVDPAPRSPSQPDVEPAAERGGRPSSFARLTSSRRLWLAAAGAVAAGVLAGIVAQSSWRENLLARFGGSPPASSAGGAPTDSSVVVRKVTLPDKMLVGSPSPDGTLFSYTDPTGNLAVVELATGVVHRLTTEGVLDTGSQFAEFSVISRDNQFVAYSWSALDGKYELRLVDIEGKRPRVLVRSDALDYPIPLQWSHDGRSILASLERPDHTFHLALVSAEDGTVRTMKDLGATRPLYASLSPDGEFVVYDAFKTASAKSRDVFIIRSDGSEERPLIEHPANDLSPVWTPDGRDVLFTSDRSGTVDVWRVAAAGGLPQSEPELIHRNVGRAVPRGLTETGSYFYNAAADVIDVYQARLVDGVLRNQETLATSHMGSNISSVWSPDGDRLAYASRRGLVGFDRGFATLVVRDQQTGEQREFTPPLTSFLTRSWSPDGRQVLVGGASDSGGQAIYAIDVDSGRLTTLIANSNHVARPEWRADGRVWYFDRSKGTLVARNVQTGAEERIADLRAQGIDPLADISGRGFRLGPDGRTLAYTTYDDRSKTRTLAVKVLGGGPARELARAVRPEMLMLQDWSPDGQTVFYTRWTKSSDPYTLWRVSIHGGDSQPVGLSMVGVRDVSVHPDGTKITFTAGWNRSELWVMENFLPKR